MGTRASWPAANVAVGLHFRLLFSFENLSVGSNPDCPSFAGCVNDLGVKPLHAILGFLLDLLQRSAGARDVLLNGSLHRGWALIQGHCLLLGENGGGRNEENA